MAIKLSPTSPTATIQAAEKTVHVTVHFSGVSNPQRESLVTVVGGRSGFSSPDYPMWTSSSFQGKSLGEGKYLIEVPVQLSEAKLYVYRSVGVDGEFDNDLFYHCVIDGKEFPPVRDSSGHLQYLLGALDSDKDVQIIGTKSPKITLHAVDEAGKPITEYYAGAQYTKNYPIARVTWNNEGVRIEFGRIIGGRATTSQVSWAQIADRVRPSSIDVDFAWRNFGKDFTRVNADDIAPGEALYLYVAAKGYDVAIQTIPKMAEGEEREVTVTLKANR